MAPVMHLAFSIDDVALAGWSRPDKLQRLLELLNEWGLRVTLFTVPLDEESGRRFDELPGGYAAILKEAHRSGHDVAQHGLRHNRFEFGIPPAMVLDLPHEAANKRYARENREKLAREQRCENLRPRLRQGREILEQALGFAVDGFRAPALQQSPGMFEALAAEQYRFDSSTYLQETGWDYISGRLEVPPRTIDRQRRQELCSLCAIPEFPLTTDYTWFLTREKFASTLELARHDFRACLRNGLPFVSLCHIDPVWEGEGIRFWREFLPWAADEAAGSGFTLKYSTLKEMVDCDDYGKQ
ncbi:MAG: DUF2334 domain-containing protein [Lentisphaeria bacterium]|nr:DUF2334 domain-containing protein [Lentisphaeria bacterium]